MKAVGSFFEDLRQTYVGNLLRWAIKYSPVVYYGSLSIYCGFSGILGSKTIAPIIGLPYVYSFLGPAILLLVVIGVRFVASILYRDRRFRSEGCLSLLVIPLAIMMAFAPFSIGLVELELKQSGLLWVDLLLITISLWDIAVRVFFSIPTYKRDGAHMYAWLEKLKEAALMSTILQVNIMAIVGFPIAILSSAVGLVDRHKPGSSLAVLAGGYLSLAIVRWLMTYLNDGSGSSLRFRRKHTNRRWVRSSTSISQSMKDSMEQEL